MKRVFASVLVACLLGSTPGFARGGLMPGAGIGHGSGRGDFGRNPTTLFVAPAPPAPVENRIPAPLPPLPQAPIINGPCSKGSCL
jgi:hypothetical protein